MPIEWYFCLLFATVWIVLAIIDGSEYAGYYPRLIMATVWTAASVVIAAIPN